MHSWKTTPANPGYRPVPMIQITKSAIKLAKIDELA
jgi:hypothetical protein